MASPCWINRVRPGKGRDYDRQFRDAHHHNAMLVIRAKAWVAAALEDDWRVEGKIYVQEPLRRACTLTKEDFRAIVISRDEPAGGRHLPAGCVTVWKGPKQLLIGLEYDWSQITALASA